MSGKQDVCEPGRLKLLAADRLPPAELAELEEHLESCPRCRGQLDLLVNSDEWITAARHRIETGFFEPLGEAADREEALHFLTPSDWPDSLGRLGTYEVKGILGRGGMGIVLKAFDSVLNRNVAIKVMAAGLAACGASRQRFLREARAAAAVVHEHVVAVYAVEESAGLPYLVMEYVPGLSLQERIDRVGPSSVVEVLRIGMQTASGLAAAHAQGLVHRDVKPANILLENSVERVRLTDFGLARAAADAGITHSGVITGTPYYMAPEQANGQPTDHRADLFSLGSTLYAACAGHPPFRAESPLAVLRRVSDDTPRPLLEINPQMPVWLEQIIARLMAKEPTERFQTAAEVAELLGRCLAHVQQPALFPLPDELQPAQRVVALPQRSRLKTAVVASAILALVGVGSTAIAFRGSWTTDTQGPQPQASERKPDQSRRSPGPPVLSGPSTQSQQSSVSSVDRREREEIQRLLDQSRYQSDLLEADLRRHDAQSDRDHFSEDSSKLLQESEALEREILSGRSPSAQFNSSLPTLDPSPRNRR